MSASEIVAGMEPSGLVEALLSPTIVALQMLLATWLFSRRHAPRENHGVRLALVVLVAIVVVVAGTLVSETTGSDTTELPTMLSEAALFCLLPFALMAATLICREASLWEALFCCTAAQTTQNLTSGVEGMMRIILGESAVNLGVVPTGILVAAIATPLVYLPCYLLLVRRLEQEGGRASQDWAMLLVMLVVALVTVAFDLVLKTIVISDVDAGYVLVLRVVHAAVCVFILYCMYEMLYNKRLQADVASVSLMLADSERQYQLSRDNIEAINLKCHDLKHQIRQLRDGRAQVTDDALSELEEAVGIYDAEFHTGNEALDVILTEKALVCERERITLSCIVDGAAMAFVAPADLYSLFGNALDNAIEAERSISDNTHRSISLMVREAAGMAVLHMENYYTGKLEFRDGLPTTSKLRADGTPDTANHGFGTRSMRTLVERYGGTLTIGAEGGSSADVGVFRLDIALPQPE